MPTRTSYEHGVPSWVDLASTDLDASKAFYGGLFDGAFEDDADPTGAVFQALQLASGD